MTKRLLTSEELLQICLESEDKPTGSDSELLDVFDENGNFLGLAPRLLCHRLGLIHQVVYVMIENDKDKILLQTRGDVLKGRLDIAVGGHVANGDKSPLEALLREMQEELAFTPMVDKLKPICIYIRISKDNLKKPKEVNREQRHVYFYKMDTSEVEKLNKNFKHRSSSQAVLRIDWFDISDILKACDESRVADGLQATLAHYLFWKNIASLKN